MDPLPRWLVREYPFRRREIEVDGYRMHLVDEGEGAPVLLLHGNPTWSFLWRKVIPLVVQAGLRAVAPDLIGFGLSDKPRDPTFHTLENHIGLMDTLVRKLDLDNLIIVGQDWGGPIGCGVAVRERERVRGVVLANTAITPPRTYRTTLFHRLSRIPVLSWLLFVGLNFPVRVMPFAQSQPFKLLSPSVARAYRFPFRRWRDRVGPLALARMVPYYPEHPSVKVFYELKAWAERFDGPVRLVWGVKDPILGRAWKPTQGAFREPIVELTDAGHFLQEEVPEKLAEAIVAVHRSAR
jgi:haloalkane dehalogenase